MATALSFRALTSHLELAHLLASRLKPRVPALVHKALIPPRRCTVSVRLVNCESTGIMFIRLIRSHPTQLVNMNYVLKYLLKCYEKPRIARSFLGQILVSGNSPDLATFYYLVQSYFKQLTYQHVLDLVFTQMKAEGVKADDSFYKCTIEGVCTHFGPYYGFHFLRKLRLVAQLQVPLYCYDVVVGKLSTRKMIDDTSMNLMLITLLKYMKRLQVFPDDKIYTYLLKGRYHGDFDSSYAFSIGSQMFAQGIRIGALIPTTALPRRA